MGDGIQFENIFIQWGLTSIQNQAGLCVFSSCFPSEPSASPLPFPSLSPRLSPPLLFPRSHLSAPWVSLIALLERGRQRQRATLLTSWGSKCCSRRTFSSML